MRTAKIPSAVPDAELLDTGAACRLLGGTRPIHPASLYRGIKRGIYPMPVKIGENSSRWLRSELLDYIARRVAARVG
jgi:predicted DNA-binding transcriptional regulator AlpA